MHELDSGEHPAARRCGPDEPGAAMLAAVVADVLHAQEARLRPAEVAPLRDARHRAAVNVDPPEEVVRGRGTSGCRRGRGSLDGVVLRSVTYSWWPGKTISAYACASLAPSCRRARPARGRRPDGRTRGASAGSGGRSCGSGAGRRGSGTGGRAATAGGPSRRTRCRPCRRRRRRGSCTPATCGSGGRPRPVLAEPRRRDDEGREAEPSGRGHLAK